MPEGVSAQPAPRRTAADIAAQMAHADEAYAAGHLDRAETAYAGILALDPAQSRATFRLAQLRARRDVAGAVLLYRRYVALEPRDAWGYMALGNALAESGDARGAIAAYDLAGNLEPHERDVHVGRARVLARVGHTDAAIAAFQRWLATPGRDVEAWRELAAQQRLAGDHHGAIASLDRARSLAEASAERQEIARAIGRNRAAVRGALTPLAGGSRDSDGLSTRRAGVTVTSPLIGTARFEATAAFKSAGDGTVARASQELTAGVQYRPRAQMRLELVAGIGRADRSFIDTSATMAPRGAPPGGPRAPIGNDGASTGDFQFFSTGRARVVWRQPGDAIRLDVRGERQLLGASPLLVAQGVMRDDASATADVRIWSAMRIRAFGRTAAIYTADERNRRDIYGGALAFAPSTYEVTVRAQRLQYAGPTALAYFAPRQVDGAEITTYIEREASSGATLAFDLGAGAQRVEDWTTDGAAWSPALRAWAQFVVPLTASVSAGTELEGYDSRIGMDGTSVAASGSRWRYGSASLWMRFAF